MSRPYPKVPDLLAGPGDVVLHLARVGIRVTTGWVKARVESGDLPRTGPPTPGGGKLAARFRREDLEAVVLAATGKRWPDWLRYWDERGRPLDLWSATQARRNPAHPYASGLFALLEADPHAVEAVVRAPSGHAYATFSESVATGWPVGARRAARPTAWKDPRLLVDDDLEREPAEGRATVLVTALVMREARLHFAAAPSAMMGSVDRLDPTPTPVILTPWHPRWREVRAYVESRRPGSMWIAWHRRRELDPETMIPLPVSASSR